MLNKKVNKKVDNIVTNKLMQSHEGERRVKANKQRAMEILSNWKKWKMKSSCDLTKSKEELKLVEGK